METKRTRAGRKIVQNNVTAQSLESLKTDVRNRLQSLPRARLAHLPTPLDRCDRLGSAIGHQNLWVKRDDCTGLAFGGNKTRELEYILGDARAQGADTVIQGAAAQSNHSRQLAAAARQLGMECHLLPRRDSHFTPLQGNHLVARLLATKAWPVAPGVPMEHEKFRLAERLRDEGRRPYVLGMGAKESLVLAAVSYTGALVEIVEQLTCEGVDPPTYIYTTSQGATQAGLQLGAMLLGLQTCVIGINPMHSDHEAYVSPDGIAELISLASQTLGTNISVNSHDVVNSTEYVGDGYGVPSAAGLEAMQISAQSEGLLFDPIYTAKGLSGLIHHTRTRRIDVGAPTIFIHTGGLPVMFAYNDDLTSRIDCDSQNDW